MVVVLYRLSELLKFLNKSNVCISYQDTLKLLRHWEKGDSSTLQLAKGAITHRSIDYTHTSSTEIYPSSRALGNVL